ncbi:MAG: DUF1501 domain-containing protein [Bryobacteraceae bacterium]
MGNFDRRSFLKLGSVSGLGLLPSYGAVRGLWTHGPATAVIHIYLEGGLSHLDSFDPKPDADSRIRGPFRTISTSVPGLRICEHLPRMAQRADRYTVIRSMTHGAAAHSAAQTLLLSGREVKPGVVHPTLGEVIANQPGQRGAAEPYVVLSGTRRLDLSGEPDAVVERYGRTALGERCLMARRLVESGARFVTVSRERNAWDHHSDIFRLLANEYLPELDRAFSALLDDLDVRGLLETTIVLVSGEFGRTPEINEKAGRDHWPHCFSAMVAGGGFEGGAVWGESDRDGMYVKDRPVELGEFVAMLRGKMGVA